MGNCVAGSNKSTAEIAPFDCVKPPAASTIMASATSAVSAVSPVPAGAVSLSGDSSAAAVSHIPPTASVRLSGSPNSLVTSYIRFALLHKKATIRFVASEDEKPTLQIGSDSVSGSLEALLRFVEQKFPEPKLMMGKFNLEGFDESTSLVVRVTWLQHRSMVWHLWRMVRWAEDLAARGGKRAVDPTVGTPRMELRKFGKSYTQLQELMLEHAQMEERILFPVLEMVDRGMCKTANEEHGRELPMINGIKEDIKSIGVLDCNSPVYREALCNLAARLKSLQKHCKEHFEEEERDLLPMMAQAEMSREEQKRALNQSLDVMKGTHSRLFEFFLEGLVPEEAMQYLDLIMRFADSDQMSFILNRSVQ